MGEPGGLDGVGVAVGGTVAVGVAEAVGVAVGVGDGPGGVGDGVGVAPPISGEGPWIPTVIGLPVLKNPIVALVACGGRLESKRKLYSVPQRIAFAFWFCARVSVLQLSAPVVWLEVHGALLKPKPPNVPSLENPG